MKKKVLILLTAFTLTCLIGCGNTEQAPAAGSNQESSAVDPTEEPTPEVTAESTATPEPTVEPTPEPTPEPSWYSLNKDLFNLNETFDMIQYKKVDGKSTEHKNFTCPILRYEIVETDDCDCSENCKNIVLNLNFSIENWEGWDYPNCFVYVSAFSAKTGDWIPDAEYFEYLGEELIGKNCLLVQEMNFDFEDLTGVATLKVHVADDVDDVAFFLAPLSAEYVDTAGIPYELIDLKHNILEDQELIKCRENGYNYAFFTNFSEE